jgi:hypothetical protein
MPDHDDQERELTESLRRIAVAEALTSGASPAVRARLLEEVRVIARGRRHSAMKVYALAAVLVIASAIPVWQLSTRTAAVRSIGPVPAAGEIATGFYPLAYSALPVTQGNIVRLELSSASLAALGVEPSDWAGPQEGHVLADVFVGEDGLARAVRFVRVARVN